MVYGTLYDVKVEYDYLFRFYYCRRDQICRRLFPCLSVFFRNGVFTYMWMCGTNCPAVSLIEKLFKEKLYRQLLKGYYPVLHLFSGRSLLGDVRVDKENFPQVTHQIRIIPRQDFRLPFEDNYFKATIADPPWINQYLLWLSYELPRVTRKRIVVISGNFWWEPSRKYKKKFKLTKIYVVKRVSPAAKLVFVYDSIGNTLF